jgi:hypothetical protein
LPLPYGRNSVDCSGDRAIRVKSGDVVYDG